MGLLFLRTFASLGGKKAPTRFNRKTNVRSFHCVVLQLQTQENRKRRVQTVILTMTDNRKQQYDYRNRKYLYLRKYDSRKYNGKPGFSTVEKSTKLSPDRVATGNNRWKDIAYLQLYIAETYNRQHWNSNANYLGFTSFSIMESWERHHHHHHHGAERSAVASRLCDLSPKWSVLCQLESISHRYSRVPADLMDPCSERSTSSTPPVGWWPTPDTVLSFAAGLEYLVCWNIVGESRNVSEQSKPSFADDRPPPRYANDTDRLAT